jgi:hypothetical protein
MKLNRKLGTNVEKRNIHICQQYIKDGTSVLEKIKELHIILCKLHLSMKTRPFSQKAVISISAPNCLCGESEAIHSLIAEKLYEKLYH